MKFNILTLGCKVNTYESNFMKESLINNGFSFCEDSSLCDIIIINTCTVTDTSDKKSLKLVRKIKRENPKAIVIVCGCSAQNNPKYYEDLNIPIILGNKQKSRIVDIINEYLKTKNNYFYVTDKRDTIFEDMQINSFNHVRAFIKVQDGCNNFCSYCIIPYVRGSVRCKDFDKTIEEATNICNNGFKEIVLTGIHTGMYNDSGKDLTDLINELSKIEGLKRIRLSSVEITELNDKFLDMLKNNKVFCDHLHIPLQSGTDEILEKMNRKYDTKFFKEKINKIRSINPDISITTDVIVGFNYETDELFEKTCLFCKEMKFAKIHVFPYSKRQGTKASTMEESVDEHTKKQRARKLIMLSDMLEQDYYNSFLGKEKDVLIETVKDGKSYGHTSNYLMVEIDDILNINEIYTREIK